jgi:hypothetical protein
MVTSKRHKYCAKFFWISTQVLFGPHKTCKPFYTPVLPCLFVCAIPNLSLGIERCGHTNHNHSLLLLHLIPPLCDKMQWGLWYVPLVGTPDLRTLWSPLVSLNQERHTQRHKAANLFFFLIFFLWRKSVEKSPMKTYMVKRAFWKISKKKLNRHISRKGKKRVLKSSHFEETLARHQNCQSFYTHNALIKKFLKCVFKCHFIFSQNSLLPKRGGILHLSYT